MFVDSKRDIATVNFVMHEVHCHRNIVLCATCDEPVPKSELERHFNDLHAPVTCHLCGQAVDKSTLDSHKVREREEREKKFLFKVEQNGKYNTSEFAITSRGGGRLHGLCPYSMLLYQPSTLSS